MMIYINIIPKVILVEDYNRLKGIKIKVLV